MVNVKDKDKIYRKVFKYLRELDFNKTNPEVIGQTFNMIKQSIGCDDPYLKTRQYYNLEFMQKIPEIEKVIYKTSQPFDKVIKYAILGNILDFNPIHQLKFEQINHYFKDIDEYHLAIGDHQKLLYDLKNAKVLLYLGDNCGEICLDKILIKMVK